jgi:hypothetical protein
MIEWLKVMVWVCLLPAIILWLLILERVLPTAWRLARGERLCLATGLTWTCPRCRGEMSCSGERAEQGGDAEPRSCVKTAVCSNSE